MKLILVATKAGAEFYIKTDLDTKLAILRFELDNMETVRHFNDDYCGDVTEDTHYDYVYLSTDKGDENEYDDYYDTYDDHYHYADYDEGDAPEPVLPIYDEMPIPCRCCGGSGYM